MSGSDVGDAGVPQDTGAHHEAAEPLRFDGRVAIVTGSGRGLGRAHAQLLASRGATVVVNDLGGAVRGGGESVDPAREVVDEIESGGGQAVADVSDVSTYSGAQHLVESTIDRFGRLDVVIANAGISDPKVPFTEMTPDRFDRMVRVHLYGTFNVLQCAWRHLQASGSGRVVLTTSNGGLFGATPDAHYAAAKMGIVGLMRSLANEGRADGIAVNAIAPGAFTRMVDAFLADGERKEKLKEIAPTGGVSPTYAWLAHESCDVTGEIFGAVGGRTTRIFIAETSGYQGASTPEQVRDHWDEIIDENGYWVPLDVPSDSQVWISTLSASTQTGP